MRRLVLGWHVATLVGLVGCWHPNWTARVRDVPAPPASLSPTCIGYVDADGFDAILESALINQDPIIVIQTNNDKPDWDGRLNAWIAAWNMGGRPAGAKVRL